MSRRYDLVPCLSPPGKSVHLYPVYDSDAPVPERVPNIFADAMIVRKAVFVDEQGCRLSEEIDADDEKAYHWVVYADFERPKRGAQSGKTQIAPTNEYQRCKARGGTVAIGTIRLVLPPHGHHPLPSSVDGVGGVDVARIPGGDQMTDYHNGRELYVKIGRMAVIDEWRGQGIAKFLVEKALHFANRNRREMGLLPSSSEEEKKAKQELGIKFEDLKWHGLVLAHSQKSAISFYKKLGFIHDEKLGSWIEEGIEHVAMWKKLF